MATNLKDYKELGCKDFKADCDFMIRAQSADEVMKYCQEHACSVHGKCGSSSDTKERIRSRIRDVRL